MQTQATVIFSIFISLSLSLANVTHAQSVDQQTVLQTSNAIENEVAALLKSFQRSQATYFAINGKYAATLKDLGFAAPSVLKDYGSLSILTTHARGYWADFVFSTTARSRGIQKDRISVNEFGIAGAPRYNTLTEAKNDIINYVKAAHIAQKAYIAEFGFPTTDLNRLGVVPPPHLYSLGQLKMEVSIFPPTPPQTQVNMTWKATFTPAEVGAPGPNPPGSVGTTTGIALRPAPPLGKPCVDAWAVKILGVTDLVYSVDHLGVTRTTAPAAKCVY